MSDYAVKITLTFPDGETRAIQAACSGAAPWSVIEFALSANGIESDTWDSLDVSFDKKAPEKALPPKLTVVK